MKKIIYVIMINYNGIEDTEKCIESIYSSNNNLFTIKTIIVDNASSVSNKERLRSLTADNNDIEVIYNTSNFGFAKANNIGLSYIHSKYGFEDNSFLYFLNNDTLLNRSLLQALEANLPSENEVLYFEMRSFDNKYVNNGLNYLNPYFGRYRETYKKKYIEYICGASIFLKNTDKVPFWNDEYFLYFEDVDYSLRLRNSGYVFRKLNNVFYNHKVGASSKNSKVNSYKIQSQKKFMKENGKCYLLFCFCKFFYLLLKFKISLLREFVK